MQSCRSVPTARQTYAERIRASGLRNVAQQFDLVVVQGGNCRVRLTHRLTANAAYPSQQLEDHAPSSCCREGDSEQDEGQTANARRAATSLRAERARRIQRVRSRHHPKTDGHYRDGQSQDRGPFHHSFLTPEGFLNVAIDDIVLTPMYETPTIELPHILRSRLHFLRVPKYENAERTSTKSDLSKGSV